MHARALPTWFWVSLILFVALQWLMIPVLQITGAAHDVVMAGILFVTFVIWPVYLAGTIVILKKVKQFSTEGLIIAAVFLMIPPFTFIPVFTAM
ncbi:hypothetical protein [Alteribacter natronophilus]|uniref:hypothetical protein n=1 Tax=Alteribacter natronophilus TaxID=2583810 RepID=UPI00110D88B9|nr:hypothetical protein [Alteribacter natronophilus]TMW70728.1 hypothetical protein FGB90_16235 [Alteribacter natronophilus]